MEPFFSVIVPVYNREKYLNRSIDSILNQSFKDWEIIIVDDGSTDNSAEIMRSYDNKNIRCFFKENGGVSSARNLGLDNAQGKYIAFLDSDDEYKKNHLEIIHEFLEKNSFPVCLICTDFMFNYDGRIVKGDNSEFINRKPDFTHLPYIISAAIHRHAIGDERLVESLKIREDNEFLDRIRSKVPSYRVAERSVIIHRHGSNTSSNPFFTKKETEKAIYYYIKTRKKFPLQEWKRLYEIYSYLTLHYFRERNSGLFILYFMKMIAASPICLFHVSSLKSTFKRAAKLLGLK